MKRKSSLITATITLFLTACNFTPSQNQATTFEECLAAGHPIMESYPRQCRTPNGLHFIEDIPNEVGKPQQNGPSTCTQEAKLCPDGSAVGRVGSNCEFAPCPGE